VPAARNIGRRMGRDFGNRPYENFRQNINHISDEMESDFKKDVFTFPND